MRLSTFCRRSVNAASWIPDERSGADPRPLELQHRGGRRPAAADHGVKAARRSSARRPARGWCRRSRLGRRGWWLPVRAQPLPGRMRRVTSPPSLVRRWVTRSAPWRHFRLPHVQHNASGWSLGQPVVDGGRVEPRASRCAVPRHTPIRRLHGRREVLPRSSKEERSTDVQDGSRVKRRDR